MDRPFGDVSEGDKRCVLLFAGDPGSSDILPSCLLLRFCASAKGQDNIQAGSACHVVFSSNILLLNCYMPHGCNL